MEKRRECNRRRRTQITLGILPALLHPKPEKCLVVGLGTGETAGWLAEVDSVKQVDIVEIEPAVTKWRDAAPR